MSSQPLLCINAGRLLARLDALAAIGAIEGGGCCRLALTDDDRRGRDQLVAWMRELGLAVQVDVVGNIFGLRAGRSTLPPVMTGSGPPMAAARVRARSPTVRGRPLATLNAPVTGSAAVRAATLAAATSATWTKSRR